VTPVGNGARRPAIGLILPATLQGELPGGPGTTRGTTSGSAKDLSELCRQAEATGADSLWAVDHLFWPHPINECLTTLAIAAAATSRPTLGSCVLQLPLRHPAEVAKQATALQHLTDGRFILGLGVGSHPGEYAQAQIDYHRRGHLMDEGIERLHQAWATAGDPTAEYRQEPASSPVPLWFGGASPAARARAARVGDGWVPLFITPEDYGPAWADLQSRAAATGRDPEAIEPAVVVFVRVGPEGEAHERGAQWLSDMYRVPPKAFERYLVAGPSEFCAAELSRFVEAGVRHVVVMMAGAEAVPHFGLLRSAFVAQSEE
jgi:alkanesulfonate monooxygenase SsuD/methylene tetrahydromethanopterin reductase-like flavin-dependent oxidoreductase (luciferase family)